MPEYLAPGVYVEETSFRTQPIQGVSTSTTGFVGPTRYGPISGEPELLTSFLDFQRVYGGLEPLGFGENFLAYAVRAFFDEGGRRLYVSRVFGPDATDARRATAPMGDGDLVLRARFPGAAGRMRVTFRLAVGGDVRVAGQDGRPPGLTRVRPFDVVYVGDSAAPLDAGNIRVATRNAGTGEWTLESGPDQGDALADQEVHPVSVTVEVARPTISTTGADIFGPDELLGSFGLDDRATNGLTRTFTHDPASRRDAINSPFAVEFPEDLVGAALAVALAEAILSADPPPDQPATPQPTSTREATFQLLGGNDGDLPGAALYAGDADGIEGDRNNPVHVVKNGLLAFESVEDISIVAAPGYSAEFLADQDRVRAVHNAVITHCETMRYRVAVLDTPPGQLVGGALDFRNQRSSTHAALYYPWVTVLDPFRGKRLQLPPSGFVAGIWARNDIENAVFKAPANEVVRSAIDFEVLLNKSQQEALNPEGVNCLRFFEGRGLLVWGARTISDNPEWRYVSVRRYFAYLERSIEESTSWAVFENNNRQLWDRVRRSVEDFLFNEWRSGGLMGDDPKQAFFVRCDETTMTQLDLDTGRLICLIGVAPVRPAEFVIFRIGQWTATSVQ